jgi:glyoxylase-like metal-dependent hydrolase (beta-lactamase superfamily II)
MNNLGEEKHMSTYQIYPILTAETELLQPGVTSAYLCYLIKGKDTVILVDAGPGDREWTKKYHKYNMLTEKSPETMLVEGLAALDITPKDIETVVLTHLHWDHIHNIHLFPNARFYVQQKEIRFALDPVPAQYHYYEVLQGGFPGPKWMNFVAQFESIDGDYKLREGIDLVLLPGHTPGFQGVLINTTGGRYLIAGDAMGFYSSWENREYGLPKPSVIAVDLIAYYETIKKMISITNYILPGHDKRVMEHPVYPFPKNKLIIEKSKEN